MILVNTSDIVGKEIIETLGIVKGSTIRAKHIGKDIAAVFRHLVGGELKEYSEMLNEARQIATKKMVEEAEKLGADAIINIRYSTSAVMQGAAEILVYGTAVKIKDAD
ncbi:YbjQ family protein [Caloranaerobacter ferrireducens]|uniref:YbjQ family protein n=1 Tax=Caloranaerobacter ferrireducens TaxID=1323370 RepID=UPI00084D9C9F|nr:YbjQ family protein [Caloranaerobacter ferrireducens]